MDQKALLEAQMMSKSGGIAAILGLFFGGFGLFYVSILNGLVGTIIQFVVIFVVIFTGGLGIVIAIPWHIVCALVGMSMANAHNKRLLKKLGDS